MPKAGVDDAPKAGVELPKAGDDEAPNAGVEGWPKTPVDAPPNTEPPVAEPKGFGLPKGFCAKGLLLALLVCPNTDCEPNGLVDDCPKAA